MEGLADRVQRMEAKMNSLATMADLEAVSILDKANKNLLDKNDPFKTPLNSAAAKTGFEMRPEFTSPFASSDNRPRVPAAYTPPQSGVFGGGNDDKTIIVKGFDSSLPEDDIKSLLTQYFSSCGEITSVVVPKDQVSGAVIGCAYIHLKEGVEKALKLSGKEVLGLIPTVVTVSAIVTLVEVLVAEEETAL
ncbi:unnamed protein product [Arabis nemorensis]|uniref:RRM domain-containing protein n=1 Tax=Arabis nemorensis TaxID=586526 RepID=A0A565AUM3_9BRAS|nr:unnamed protein product [Arabis nemorensis]